MIDLYTWGTPNGYKVSIMLEACQLPYQVHPINILEEEQFAPEFLTISPNNKIPAIVDPDGPAGEPVALFESGAILLYLAEKTGLFLPEEPRERLDCIQWLMWQMGGFGPFLGQAHHFNRFAPEPVPYAIERYNKEARRLWQVLDRQLAGKRFVVGDDLTIADFAIYPWAMRYPWQSIDPADFPAVADWMELMGGLEFVKYGMQVP
ncbi:glutathione S-transferase C-terminal domain-containing protein [Marinobacterium arenosum]|uniref:glutathione S-transferase C-terminal domain-containing protein n=1 Tax=Marinobacterium arenosum TaxID=2862496 RepID=UPI001C97D4FA|nr:glutathione S-transferase C-terminal domain-containing protein [Marinobacterium arenosum]MBY4676944.1 glutathione S-transferase N-terminal domain-containing protein [Marinobacterium arenosum]